MRLSDALGQDINKFNHNAVGKMAGAWDDHPIFREMMEAYEAEAGKEDSFFSAELEGLKKSETNLRRLSLMKGLLVIEQVLEKKLPATEEWDAESVGEFVPKVVVRTPQKNERRFQRILKKGNGPLDRQVNKAMSVVKPNNFMVQGTLVQLVTE